jgi:Na+/melibiose symporter-like transporter
VSEGARAFGRVGALALAALVLLTASWIVERRAVEPLLPARILTSRDRRAANIVATVLPLGGGAVLFIGTLYLQRILGFSALQTGLAYLALAVPVIACSPVASWLLARWSARRVAIAGFLLQVAGLAYLARQAVDGTFLVDVLPALVAVGAGMPIAWVPTTRTAMAGAGEQSGVISGIFNTSQQLGNAVTLAAVATLAAAVTAAYDNNAGSAALAAGYRAGFLLATVLVLMAVAGAVRLRDVTDVGPLECLDQVPWAANRVDARGPAAGLQRPPHGSGRGAPRPKS